MVIQRKVLSFLILCALALAGIAASVLWRQPGAAVELSTGTYLRPSRALADFSLIDQRGKIFSSARLRGQWTLLFFGYTNCPDFCPTTLTTLAELKRRLRAAKAVVLPQVIFVTVDAKRDTPAKLAMYIPYFDTDFIGLTGADQSSVAAIAQQLGVSVSVGPSTDGNYAVDHSAAIYVLNPDGRLAAILTGPFDVQALLGDFERIVAAHGVLAGRV